VEPPPITAIFIQRILSPGYLPRSSTFLSKYSARKISKDHRYIETFRLRSYPDGLSAFSEKRFIFYFTQEPSTAGTALVYFFIIRVINGQFAFIRDFH
jgi:hypothetical protein